MPDPVAREISAPLLARLVREEAGKRYQTMRGRTVEVVGPADGDGVLLKNLATGVQHAVPGDTPLLPAGTLEEPAMGHLGPVVEAATAPRKRSKKKGDDVGADIDVGTSTDASVGASAVDSVGESADVVAVVAVPLLRHGLHPQRPSHG